MKAWQTRALGDVAAIGSGNSAPQHESLFVSGTVPFFRTADAGRIRFGEIFDATDKLNEEGAKGLRRFPKGTILFPKSGASTFLNHRIMLGVEGCVSSHLATIVADEKQAHSRFLLYFLATVVAQDLIQDHSYPSLNIPAIAGIKVNLPPLAEQRRIAGMLDEAFASLATAQAHAEKNVQNARALFESHLESVFARSGKGWAKARLGDLAEFKNGLNFTRQSKGQRLRIVGVGDFQDNAVVPTEALQSVTIDGKLSDDYLIRRNDILTVRSNGSKDLVGRCMLVPEIDDRTSFSGFLIRIRFDTTKVSPRFLLRYLKSSKTRARLTRAGGGANISNINQVKLSELPLALPSFQEQEDIADRIDALATETQCLERLYQEKLASLVALKRSVLNQAFSGALEAG